MPCVLQLKLLAWMGSFEVRKNESETHVLKLRMHRKVKNCSVCFTLVKFWLRNERNTYNHTMNVLMFIYLRSCVIRRFIIPINVQLIFLLSRVDRSVHVSKYFKQITRNFQKKMFCKSKCNKIRIKINQIHLSK